MHGIERLRKYIDAKIQDPQRFKVIPRKNGYYVHDLVTDAEYFSDMNGGVVEASLYGESVILPEEFAGWLVIAVQDYQKKNPHKSS